MVRCLAPYPEAPAAAALLPVSRIPRDTVCPLRATGQGVAHVYLVRQSVVWVAGLPPRRQELRQVQELVASLRQAVSDLLPREEAAFVAAVKAAPAAVIQNYLLEFLQHLPFVGLRAERCAPAVQVRIPIRKAGRHILDQDLDIG